MAGLARRYGIFGGTFDPPHIGHLVLASEACYQLELDKVLWVLTPDPPHKQGCPVTPVSVRLDLLLAAIEDDPAFELCRIDSDRPPPHYAADTVQLLHRDYPGAELVYLMGGDSLADLPTWHAPLEFIAACDEIGVMLRPGRRVRLAALEKVLPGLSSKVRFLKTPLLQVSSSVLRQWIAGGHPYRYYVSDPVYRIVEAKKLYRKS